MPTGARTDTFSSDKTRETLALIGIWSVRISDERDVHAAFA